MNTQDDERAVIREPQAPSVKLERWRERAVIYDGTGGSASPSARGTVAPP